MARRWSKPCERGGSRAWMRASATIDRGGRPFAGGHRDREEEAGSLAEARPAPDLPLVALDDLLAGRQAKAGAFEFAMRMQTRERLENFAEMLFLDADAVVADFDRAIAIVVAVSLDMHLGPFRLAIFDPVADEVLQELGQLSAVGEDGREAGKHDARLRLADRRIEIFHHVPHQIVKRNVLILRRRIRLRIGMELIQQRIHAHGALGDPLGLPFQLDPVDRVLVQEDIGQLGETEDRLCRRLHVMDQNPREHR